MSDHLNEGAARPPFQSGVSRYESSSKLRCNEKIVRQHPAILRVSAISAAGILSLLMVTAVVPPIVADQSDRAVVNAPVTLLTAPISGVVDALPAITGGDVRPGDVLAQVSNPRLDRGTLISLQEKSVDTREKLEAARATRDSDRTYVAALDTALANHSAQLKNQLQSQIEELRARVAQSVAMSGEKKALVDRQNIMVTRDTASIEMVKPTAQQYSAALHNTAAENAKLNQKLAQREALDKGIYVGDDLMTVSSLAQKRRDIDLDSKRMEIEEAQQSAVLADLQQLIGAERKRLESLAEADVVSAGAGKVLNVAAAVGRHVSAGDTISSIVDCDKRFVVAIFSYRQGQSMPVGTRVRIDGNAFHSGAVTAVLPKTSDKVDERFAVPFPQTERRELYTIITPDGTAGYAASATAASTQNPVCTVGEWVTVTRDNGVVPSMSVTWRRIGDFVASWIHGASRNAEAAPAAADTKALRAGIAQLKAAFRSPLQQQLPKSDEDWLPQTRSLVSR